MANLLAPKAAERMKSGKKEPCSKLDPGSGGEVVADVVSGRTRKGQETSPNLGEVSDTRTQKAAAIGTGYSGSTLDKVDEIRDVAEKGTTKIGGRCASWHGPLEGCT